MGFRKFNYHNALFLCLMLLTTFMWGCKDADDEINLDLVSFNDVRLLGEKEVPARETNGAGVFNGVYNKNTNVMTFNVTWALGNWDDNTVGMHFHGPATPDTNAPVLIPVTDASDNSAGTYSGSTRALTDEEEKELLSGKWYFNIHSTTYPAGELRGNLMRK